MILIEDMRVVYVLAAAFILLSFSMDLILEDGLGYFAAGMGFSTILITLLQEDRRDYIVLKNEVQR